MHFSYHNKAQDVSPTYLIFFFLTSTSHSYQQGKYYEQITQLTRHLFWLTPCCTSSTAIIFQENEKCYTSARDLNKDALVRRCNKRKQKSGGEPGIFRGFVYFLLQAAPLTIWLLWFQCLGSTAMCQSKQSNFNNKRA